ncbi:MAG TPA: RNA polymerase sigma factor [Steroidobacteraceae bacterium]|jgi:RNA polymerase sigma-70 factor (ECF subfamily)
MDALISQLRYLKKLLRRRGRTAEEAEDLVQDAFVRMQEYCREGGCVREPRAFLARTVLNLAVDARRRDRRDLYEKQPIEELYLVDLTPSPDEVFAADQRLLSIRRSLAGLSERTQTAFFLHRLEGFSYAEIALRLGVSASAVEKHIATAVARLAMERHRI